MNKGGVVMIFSRASGGPFYVTNNFVEAIRILTILLTITIVCWIISNIYYHVTKKRLPKLVVEIIFAILIIAFLWIFSVELWNVTH